MKSSEKLKNRQVKLTITLIQMALATSVVVYEFNLFRFPDLVEKVLNIVTLFFGLSDIAYYVFINAISLINNRKLGEGAEWVLYGFTILVILEVKGIHYLSFGFWYLTFVSLLIGVITIFNRKFVLGSIITASSSVILLLGYIIGTQPITLRNQNLSAVKFTPNGNIALITSTQKELTYSILDPASRKVVSAIPIPIKTTGKVELLSAEEDKAWFYARTPDGYLTQIRFIQNRYDVVNLAEKVQNFAVSLLSSTIHMFVSHTDGILEHIRMVNGKVWSRDVFGRYGEKFLTSISGLDLPFGAGVYVLADSNGKFPVIMWGLGGRFRTLKVPIPNPQKAKWTAFWRKIYGVVVTKNEIFMFIVSVKGRSKIKLWSSYRIGDTAIVIDKSGKNYNAIVFYTSEGELMRSDVHLPMKIGDALKVKSHSEVDSGNITAIKSDYTPDEWVVAYQKENNVVVIPPFRFPYLDAIATEIF